MSERLPTGITVAALLRRVNDAGGMGMVRARGDQQAGGVLYLLDEGGTTRVLERGLGPDGAARLIESRASGDSAEAVDDYWRRRRARDPDLWVVELNIPQAERLVAETIGLN